MLETAIAQHSSNYIDEKQVLVQNTGESYFPRVNICLAVNKPMPFIARNQTIMCSVIFMSVSNTKYVFFNRVESPGDGCL